VYIPKDWQGKIGVMGDLHISSQQNLYKQQQVKAQVIPGTTSIAMAIETIPVHYQTVASQMPGTNLPFYHTLVVYTDSNGNQWACRGGSGL